MKKIYEAPATQVINVELQTMIASSEGIVKGGNYNGSSAIESRGDDIWADDEYDEEW